MSVEYHQISLVEHLTLQTHIHRCMSCVCRQVLDHPHEVVQQQIEQIHQVLQEQSRLLTLLGRGECPHSLIRGSALSVIPVIWGRVRLPDVFLPLATHSTSSMSYVVPPVGSGSRPKGLIWTSGLFWSTSRCPSAQKSYFKSPKL